MLFSELPLHEQVLEGTKAAHFEACMPVQEKVLPVSIEGSDVMVQSKTGSGKTAVYVITFLEKYLRMRDQGKSSACLIIAPTRELAQQIADDAMILCSKVEGFHIGCFYGGVGYEHQRKQLQMGCDMYIGTPGRLLEFMEHHELDGKRIDTFIIDEADRMFDMGFYPDVKRMFRFLADKSVRQTLLFSATLEMRVRDLAWEFMNDPAEIDLEPDHITVETITQEIYHVAKSEKFGLFLQLLASEKPEFALVFTNSRHMAEEICARLRLNGYNADYLTGDLPQAQRQKALDKLKEGKTAFLVATDVAARGLQVNDLPLVVNYDIPEDYENYVHRIGRTARAGKSGKAITLADEEFVYGLEAIEKYIKMKIPVVWPENLPEVEDKSIGKSWRVRPERPQSQSRSGQGHSKSQSQKPQGQKSQNRPSGNKASSNRPEKGSNDYEHKNPKNKYSSDRTNTKSLGAMTEEERLAYYRKKYGFEPKGAAKPTDAKKPQSQKPAPKKANGAKTAKVEPVLETKKAEAPAEPAKKKESFFKRLFGRRK
ncbi:MAG: DEAD/DEAH box helicase [Sphaerochaetaceae bacterium]|nr:DEAD/DEAH box helicase [Sphaerochaetaceae bacterium]